ncbi:hypothetical protein NITGR_710027 [Nitrospina gracilis 3/211]|uniref:Uncharacterized protein n=1 Tax=Nitrospina gracilis (strain 3/211) TaxID=1266370 RepID=M1Z197_NITG3|nr:MULTISPECIES: hypothetical protein [Nitrospina]MCF8724352.1 hypothetical protein [Nitrospina sp. Nb-3]CCQ91505.1 hypothetical protein NITGR_710027 [Nitrospina gracilis 3/211]
MGSPNVEDLDDEELLVLYENTKKLLEARSQEDNSNNNSKRQFLQDKLQNIEDELRVRSLLDGD